MLVALEALAQPLAMPSRAPACGSVVVVRCEPATAPAPKETARRADESRWFGVDGLELDRIVIEADPLRPALGDTLSRPFAARPRSGTRTFAIGEGAQCTCMNRCPPPPLPCCDCSSPMSRYGAMPGASLLR